MLAKYAATFRELKVLVRLELEEIIVFLLYCRCESPAPKISCVVSLGCGSYPSAPLGNTDIAEALRDRKPGMLASRVKELLTMLVSTVCP